MGTSRKRLFLALISFLLLSLFSAVCTGFPSPVPNQRVYDFGNYMPDAARRDALNREILTFERATAGAPEIAVVTVPHTEGRTVNDYATGLLRQWGIGQHDTNNGVLLLISQQADAHANKTFIAVGYGLEGVLPDIVCARIINETIIPIARGQHNPQGAIEAGARAIMYRLGGRGPQGPMNALNRSKNRSGPPAWFVAFIVLMIMFIFVIIFIQSPWVIYQLNSFRWSRHERKRIHAYKETMRATLDTLVSKSVTMKAEAEKTLRRASDGPVLTSFESAVAAANIKCLDALKLASDLLRRDAFNDALHALRDVETNLGAIKREIDAVRCRWKTFEEAQECLTGTIATCAATIEIARTYFDELRGRGYRIPNTILDASDALLTAAKNNASESDVALRDPVTTKAAAERAAELAEQEQAIWHQRLTRAQGVEQFLIEVPTRLSQVRALVPAAKAALIHLRRKHVASIAQPAERAFSSAMPLFDTIPSSVLAARRANSMVSQAFDEASAQQAEIAKQLNTLEAAVNFPKMQLAQADLMKADMKDWPEMAKSFVKTVRDLKGNSDVTTDTRKQLVNALVALETIGPRAHTRELQDWIALSTEFAAIIRVTAEFIKKAQAEVDAAVNARSSASSNYYSSTEYSVPTYSPPSVDCGGFGGGDGGGAGAGGGFD